MVLEAPSGYLTKTKASKKYKRSTRALEGDLADARLSNDQDFLSQCVYVSRQTDPIPATELSAEEVKQMMDNGQIPLLCLSENLLSYRYQLRVSRTDGDTQETEEPVPTTRKPISTIQPASTESRPSSEIIDLYKQSIEDKDEEIAFLRGQIEEKDQQIAEKSKLEEHRNELEKQRLQREKETNALMRQLGSTIGQLKAGESEAVPKERDEDNKKMEVTPRPILVVDVEDKQPRDIKRPKKAPAKSKKTNSMRKKRTSKEPVVRKKRDNPKPKDSPQPKKKGVLSRFFG